MRVLVVGSGGREHALVWKLAQSRHVAEIHAAPGNPGIARLAQLHAVETNDIRGLVGLARRIKPDLVVIGPEAPLVAGLGDELRATGMQVFGPDASAARIEGSKGFARDVMQAAGVPMARSLTEAVAPCVLKADGLAAGKGVFVCPTPEDVELALPKVRAFGGDLIIEEMLVGQEISVFAICDREEAVVLPVAQDYKRIGEGGTGPNTGGMGSYSPAAIPGGTTPAEVLERVHRPVLRELSRRGCPFQGLLYAGLMVTEDATIVLEFNCRFGDPETQSILPRVDQDLFELLLASAQHNLESGQVEEIDAAAVTVVMASPGYPDSPKSGSVIRGADGTTGDDVLVFHAGTSTADGALVSAGGRVLNITGVGPSIEIARERAYDGIDSIDFPDSQYRKDIARVAIKHES